MYYEIEFTIFYIISKIQKLGELDIFSYLFIKETQQYLGVRHSVYQWNTARQNSFTNETDTPFGHQKTRPYTLENTNVITILFKPLFLWRFKYSKKRLPPFYNDQVNFRNFSFSAGKRYYGPFITYVIANLGDASPKFAMT